MRKILLTLVVILSGSSVALGQNKAEIIVERYMNQCNYQAFDASEGAQYFEVDIEVNAEGVKQTIATRMILLDSEKKMRIEMDMMGQNIQVVSNGTKFWMVLNGHAQEIDETQADQFSQQVSINGNTKISKEDYDMELIEEDDEEGLCLIRLTPKGAKAGEKPIIATFDKEDGMLIAMDMETEEGDVMTTTILEYMEIGDDICMPSLIEMSKDDKVISRITIKNCDLEYDVTDEMFEI